MKPFEATTIGILQLFAQHGPMTYEQVLTHRRSETMGLSAEHLRKRLKSMHKRGTITSGARPGLYSITDYGRKAIQDPSNGTSCSPRGLHTARDNFAQAKQRTMARAKARPAPATNAPITNASMPPMNAGERRLSTPLRPGSEDHRRHPSRMGNCLIYLDGRVELITTP